jgi:hypothetical protein
MSIDSDIMDMASFVEEHGDESAMAMYGRICTHINVAEATVASSVEQVTIANANVNSNNNLFNYLIDQGIIDRNSLVKHKIAANIEPSWAKDYIVSSS